MMLAIFGKISDTLAIDAKCQQMDSLLLITDKFAAIKCTLGAVVLLLDKQLMHHFIVIGNPISHSKSPQIHHAFAESVGLDISYQRQFCPDHADSFVAVVQAFFAGGGVGANVTLPFKQIAYELCRDTGALSADAQMAKAVNTLMLKDGKLYGDNTDGRGLVSDLISQGVMLANKRIGIVGAGGATRGALLPLLNQGARISVYNRTHQTAVQLIAEFDHPNLSAHSLDELRSDDAPFDVIINATSATTTNQALDLGQSRAHFAYDMMYGKPSQFLAHYQSQGAGVSDGYGMLINQAKLAFELWTAQSIDLGAVSLPQ